MPAEAPPTLVMVYSPTCPHCVAMQPAWQQVRAALRGVMPVKEYEVSELNMRAAVGRDALASIAAATTEGVPHIFVACPRSSKMVMHTGPRDSTSLMRFVVSSVRSMGTSSRRPHHGTS